MMAPLYVSEHSEFDTVEFLSSPKRIKKIHWDIWQNIRYHEQFYSFFDLQILLSSRNLPAKILILKSYTSK